MAGIVGLAVRGVQAAGKALKQYARGSGSRKADSFEKTRRSNEERRAARQALRKRAGRTKAYTLRYECFI